MTERTAREPVDIVDRLRKHGRNEPDGDGFGWSFVTDPDCREAADEIDRLRGQVVCQAAAATHDPTGADHLADAVRLAEENDSLRAEVEAAHANNHIYYEAAQQARAENAVADNVICDLNEELQMHQARLAEVEAELAAARPVLDAARQIKLAKQHRRAVQATVDAVAAFDSRGN